ncbi:MAG: type II toxin-antitoxin system RatA family toxin [Pseudomonadota bacterium]|nr:type II toxin-antitoxin system RatA family toxin [Pseudomonadota bacterium]
MKQVKKSVLLSYSAHEIYALVVDVESYPAFLPWCERAEIVGRHDDGVTARLQLAYAGVRQAFTTRNVQIEDTSVHVGLVDGPFSLLDGLWRFLPLSLPSESPGQGGGACKIEFEMRYAFASGVLEAAISPVFDRIANTLVDSFVRRAETVHGRR